MTASAIEVPAITIQQPIINGTTLLPLEQNVYVKKQVLASIVMVEDIKWEDYLFSTYDSTTANLIYSLAKCESGRRPNIKVLDINDRYSFGLLQFQRATFNELCNGDIMNPIHQIDCAIKILNTENRGWYRWCNCLWSYYADEYPCIFN